MHAIIFFSPNKKKNCQLISSQKMNESKQNAQNNNNNNIKMKWN